MVIINNTQTYVNITCQVDSNPKALIYWLKNDEILHFGETLNLTSSKILTLKENPNDHVFDGEYTCKSRIAGYEDIYSKTSIITQGPPFMFGKKVFFIGDGDLNIEFKVLASPEYQQDPICTKLSYNDSSSNYEIILPIEKNDKYSLEKFELTNREKRSTKFQLKIKNPNDADVGFYNCTIYNSYGVSTPHIFQITKKSIY